jgi:carbon-monoxide dehydrogenase large subunit
MAILKYAIGQSVPRTEDPRLLKGRGSYVDDFTLPLQAFAVMVRSPHAHADIKSIDTSAAMALPGVLAVLTGADYEADGLGSIVGPSPFKRRDGSPMFRPPRPAVTRDRVRHVGQVVAVVVADSVNIAKDAGELVSVDYETLPVVIATDRAAREDAPRIWEDCPSNESFLYECGDQAATDAAIASAPHVFSQRFVINRVHASTMEPRGALADYNPGRDHYTIYAGMQRPFAARGTLCKNIFHIRENQLRFVTGDMGGSFGMKGAIYPEIPLVAWASRRVGRPVKWRCDRSEGFVADDHARDNVSTVDLALDDDGKFLAFRIRTTANLGAYLSSGGFGPPTNNIGGLAGVYTTPAIHVRVSAVFTNTCPTSAYRGAGRPEASYILERIIDIAAREMGIDPAELRLRRVRDDPRQNAGKGRIQQLWRPTLAVGTRWQAARNRHVLHHRARRGAPVGNR